MGIKHLPYPLHRMASSWQVGPDWTVTQAALQCEMLGDESIREYG